MLIKNKKFTNTINGLLVAICFYLTFAMSTIAHGRDFFWWMHIAFEVISLVLLKIYYDNSEKNIRFQLAQLNHFMVFVSVLMLLGSVNCLINNKQDPFMNFEILSQFIFGVFFIFMEVVNIQEWGRKKSIRIQETVRQYWGIIVLSALCVLLSYDTNMLVYKYDGMLYYSVADKSSIYSLSSLAYYGHLAQGAALIIAFFIRLTGGNTEVGIWMANALVLVLGGLSFYGTLKELVPQKKDYIYVLTTAIYFFSPFLLGMSGYVSMDFYTVCLFMCVVYFTITERWIMQVATGTIFACTKEPAFIIYGCICLGVLIVDFTKCKWKIFRHSRYYGMALSMVMWLGTLMFIGIWNAGKSSVGISVSYIISKLKVLYILNFSWFFVILSLVGMLLIFITSKEDAIKLNVKLFPVYLSLLAFTLFSILFNTVNHARYTDTVPVCLYLFSALSIVYFSDKLNRYVMTIFAGTIALGMLVSTYLTIDPLSIALFEDAELQKGKILSLSSKGFYMGDHMLYNRQGLFLEGAYSRMIEDAVSNDYGIIIPADNKSTYYLDGLIGPIYVGEGEYIIHRQYWDEKSHRRMNVSNTSGTPYEVYSVCDISALRKAVNECEKSFFIYSWVADVEENLFEEICDNYRILGEKDYFYRGWHIKSIIFLK